MRQAQALAGPFDFYKPAVIGAPTDGTTVAGREAYARLVSQAVVEVSNDIQAVIDQKFSLLKVLNRPAFSIPATVRARETLQDAIFQLKGVFLPAALAAINDYQRPMSEVADTIRSYLENVQAQIRTSLSIEASQNFSSFFNRVISEGEKLAHEGIRVSAKTITNAINKAAEEAAGGLFKSPVTVLLLAGAGLFGAAWLYRSFK
jgi:hypothetical protein